MSDTLFERGVELSIGQKSYYSMESYEPEETLEDRSLVIGVLYYPKGVCDPDALEKAYFELLRRNEILRMKLVRSGKEVRQVFSDPEAFPRPYRRKLQGGLQAIRAYCSDPVIPAISVFDEELIRAELLLGEDGACGLLIWQHHIQSDGFSQGIGMYSQLSDYYSAYCEGREPEGGPAAFQFTQFVEWESKFYKKHKEKDSAYWKKTLLHHTWMYRVPFKYSSKESRQKNCTLEITGDRYEAFLRCQKDNRVSDNAILMTAMAGVVYLEFRAKRFQMKSESHGRTVQNQKKLLGALRRSLPVFFDFCDDTTALECLKHTNQSLIEASIHSSITEDEMSALSWTNYLFSFSSFSSEYWMSFNNLRSYQTDAESPLDMELLEQKNIVQGFDVDINDIPGGIGLLFQYLEKYLTPERARRWVSEYYRSLDVILSGEDRSVSEWVTLMKG